jgi:hypothetical protein
MILRVHDELLPLGEWRAAFGILTYLMRNPNLKQDNTLYERAVDLLDRCRENLLSPHHHVLLGGQEWRRAFPGAVIEDDEEAVEQYRNSIIKRGQLMLLGER